MTMHTRNHGDRLFEILAASEPEAQFQASELAGCADCRLELEECLTLEHELGELAVAERREIAAARAVALDAEPGRAELALAARIRPPRVAAAQTTNVPRPPRTLPWAILGTAAAAALLLLLTPERPPPVDPATAAGSPAKLGDRLVPTHPLGEVETYAPFEWDAELSAAGWFRVEVLGTDADWNGAPIRSPRLREASWQPTAEELARMPASIRWRVELHHDSNARDVLDASSARARLQQP